MKIAVELPWDSRAHMGTGVYSETMLLALAAAAPDAEIVALVTPGSQPFEQPPPNLQRFVVPARGKRDTLYRHVAIPAALETLQPDCLFAPATLLPAIRVCPTVVTVHDLTFITQPELYSEGLCQYLGREFIPSLNLADHIVAIASKTRSDLEQHLGIATPKITVIEQPIRPRFTQPLPKDQVDAICGSLEIQNPYFFHLSNLAPHKNVFFALDAFAAFLRTNSQAPHQFYFAGGGIAPNAQPDPMAHAQELGIADRVRYLGRLPDEALQGVFQGCSAFLFPSLAEGWGLPVAEANALGIPVLASEAVPAAEDHQRLKLAQGVWAQALEQPERFAPRKQPISFECAGRALFSVLAATVRQTASPIGSRVELPSRLQAPRSASLRQSQKAPTPTATTPRRIRIGYRGDWHSPSGLPIEAVIGISTDKACKPVNVMGMTKAIHERMIIQANLEAPDTRFVCVRYGNVLDSRGSAIPLFRQQIRAGGPVTLTTQEMTRFLIPLDHAVDTVFAVYQKGRPGETYIPKIGASRMVDVAQAMIGNRDIPLKVVGIRPGEKIHEILISEEEAGRTVDLEDYYAIQPILPEIASNYPKVGISNEYSSADHTLTFDGTVALLHKNRLLDENTVEPRTTAAPRRRG